MGNGRASGFLDRLQIDDMIRSFGKSAGRYRNRHYADGNVDIDKSKSEHICIIVFGVGITEGLPVARKELECMIEQEKEEQHNNDDDDDEKRRGKSNNKVT